MIGHFFGELRQVTFPTWVLVALAISVALAAARAETDNTDSRPDPYIPLPQIDVSPMVLDDGRAVIEYVNAFPFGEYRMYAVPGSGQFYVDKTGDVIKRSLVAGYQWEPHVGAILKKFVEPGSVVVDVGAHIGTHAVPVSRMVGPWGRVYAFEPQRKLYRELHHNLAVNGITNVIPLRYALGEGKPRIVEMNPAVIGNEGGTGIGSGGDHVELRTLDSFGFRNVSVIKIDVEGHENSMLRGAAKTIRENEPAILIEIVGGSAYDTASPAIRSRIRGTWNLLEELGYAIEQARAGTAEYLALPVSTNT